MIATPDRQQMTPEEYLIWESQQDIRHKYLQGEFYAMTGGTLTHNDIAAQSLQQSANSCSSQGLPNEYD